MSKELKQMETTLKGKTVKVHVHAESEYFYFVSKRKDGKKKFVIKKEPKREE